MALSATAAFACCGCGGCAAAYVPPPPVVYAPSCGACQQYVAPRLVYAPPCATCGVQPAYRVDLGPTYTQPVETEEEPAVEYGYRRSYPDVGRYDRDRAWRHAHGMHHRVSFERRSHLLGGPRLAHGPRMHHHMHTARGPGRPHMLHR
jgi:hypothetical protein